MRKSVFVVVLVCLILTLALSTLLFACQKDKSPLTLVVEGEATRGAVCKIYAIANDLDNLEDVEFFIEEDYDWVTIKGDELLFSKNAEVGKIVTVCVRLGEYEDKKKLTVGATPVTSVSIDDLPYFEAGSSFEITPKILPDYATDIIPVFEVVAGKDLAHFEGSTLFIDEGADYTDDISIRVTAGGKSSEVVPLYVSTVQPRSLELVAEKYELKRGEQTKITCKITPSNCTLGNAELTIPESEYYDYLYFSNQGVLTIKDNAPEGEITINAKLGKLTAKLTIFIVKTPVEQVLFSSTHTSELKFGDVVELFADVIPKNATNSTLHVSVKEGADSIRFDENKLIFEVITKEVAKKIVFEAEADGVKSTLSFTTIEVKAQDLNLFVDGSVSVSVGEERTITATIIPENTTNQKITFEIVAGNEFATLNGNKISFLAISDDGKTEVKVKAKIDDVERFISFFIVPIPTESVTISTEDQTTNLASGDRVTFQSVVIPENASFGRLSYHIESGEQYGELQGNVFVVNPAVSSGRVVIYAQTQDGVKSNKITLDILGFVEYFAPKDWSSLNNNPNLFAGFSSVKLDLTALPLDSDFTTIIISDDVDYLELFGAYDGENFIIKNLNFYFLTTDYINVRMENIGIVANGGFNDFVFDFGNSATVSLDIVGKNYIEASSALMPNPSGYLVDGLISGSSSDYLRKRGMDGFPGLNGGTCVNGFNLEFSGEGKLTLVAGSGSNGTDATKGADSSSGVFAGSGGNGGYGGNSGFCIFASVFTCNVKGELILIGGNGGVGGNGGIGGKSVTSAYDGANGEKGADGIAEDPIFVSSTFIALTNNYTLKKGKVQSNSKMRMLELSRFMSTIEKYYNITLHYNTTYMPHTGYKVKALNSASELTKMMNALDYSLATFPKNLYLEIMQKTGSKIDIYFTESITRTLSGAVIYGLTSTVNNVWFATFNTTLRGVYYSTPFNIMTHEFLHVLTFGLDSATQSKLETNVKKYNLGLSYTTNSQGVYDPEKGYNADNSVFLCAYSKTDYREDISDNLSLIGMVVQKPDYLEEGKPFLKKVQYINSVFEEYYANLTPYTLLSWKKFI